MGQFQRPRLNSARLGLCNPPRTQLSFSGANTLRCTDNCTNKPQPTQTHRHKALVDMIHVRMGIGRRKIHTSSHCSRNDDKISIFVRSAHWGGPIIVICGDTAVTWRWCTSRRWSYFWEVCVYIYTVYSRICMINVGVFACIWMCGIIYIYTICWWWWKRDRAERCNENAYDTVGLNNQTESAIQLDSLPGEYRTSIEFRMRISSTRTQRQRACIFAVRSNAPPHKLC